jgi:hypothetical protein
MTIAPGESDCRQEEPMNLSGIRWQIRAGILTEFAAETILR